MAGDLDSSRFSAGSAARALALACADVGLDAAGAKLLRLGENAIYELPADRLVVRIARSVRLAARVEREVQVARWLAAQGFPAVRIVESLDQPQQVDGRLVTFWESVPPSGDEPTFEDLATL
ncbi:MAG TPA: phosphotransferase, partial [Mycobacterium sp.]|nr:phosphotransferase [Mycobacterium sp.]